MPATLRFLSGWLNGKNVGNLYEFAGPHTISEGRTAREAGSLPYSWQGNHLTANSNFYRKNDTGLVLGLSLIHI